MKHQPELIRESAHTLKMTMEYCTSDLLEHMLKTDMLNYLLTILGGNIPECVKTPVAAKAEIVDALKCCCRDPQHGDRISELLRKSPVWKQYQDQRHDLFLPTSTQTQAITGPTAGHSAVAGYLTDAMFEPPPSRLAPPPTPPSKKQ